MPDSIRMIEKLVVSQTLDAQPAFVLRVIRVARDLCDFTVFLMNQDAAPGHATLTNRPDDFFFHVSPPGSRNYDHHIPFLWVFQSNLRLGASEKKRMFVEGVIHRRLGWPDLGGEALGARRFSE